MRAVRAVIGGCALAALAVTAGLTLFNFVSYGGRQLDFLTAMIGFLVCAFLLDTVLALSVGLLWHNFAQRRGWTSVHAYWPPAVLLGAAIPMTLMGLPLTAAGEIRPSIDTGWMSTFALLMTLGVSFGGLTAIFAWLIRRPDRDAPNPPTPAP